MDLLSASPEQVTAPETDYSRWTLLLIHECVFCMCRRAFIPFWSAHHFCSRMLSLLSPHHVNSPGTACASRYPWNLDLSCSQICTAIPNSCCVKWRQCPTLGCPKVADPQWFHCMRDLCRSSWDVPVHLGSLGHSGENPNILSAGWVCFGGAKLWLYIWNLEE